MTELHDRATWLRGDFFHCLQPPGEPGWIWRLVLLGPPGVGKRTQAEMLAAELGACLLSTADVFQAARARSLAPGSEMAEAVEQMNRGLLVPDDIVLNLVRNRRSCLRCSGGFVLDGFPRTMVQASALEGLLALDHLKLDAVISYELPFSVLATRLANRRVCNRCHCSYNLVSRPPHREGVCDRCGTTLVRRADDAPAAIAARLAAYREATAQVAEYYKRLGMLLSIDAAQDPEEIFVRTIQRLASHRQRRARRRSLATPQAGTAKKPVPLRVLSSEESRVPEETG